MVSVELVRGIAKSNLRSLGKKKITDIEYEEFLSPQGIPFSISHDDTLEQLLARLQAPTFCEVHDNLADCEAANFTCATQHAKAKKHRHHGKWGRANNPMRGKGINEKRICDRHFDKIAGKSLGLNDVYMHNKKFFTPTWVEVA
jgi:hypothetical protein